MGDSGSQFLGMTLAVLSVMGGAKFALILMVLGHKQPAIRPQCTLGSLLAKQGRPQGALRVAVIGGGCSGLQYKMDLVDGPANRDIIVTSQEVRVVIDPKSALFVSGSVLDFSDDLQKGGFKVTNPNAEAHCSCGESFSA